MKKLLTIVMLISSMQSFAYNLTKNNCRNLPINPGNIVEVVLKGPFERTHKKDFVLGEFAVQSGLRNSWRKLIGQGHDILKTFTTSWKPNMETYSELMSIDQGLAQEVILFGDFVKSIALGWYEEDASEGLGCNLLSYFGLNPNIDTSSFIEGVTKNSDGNFVIKIHSTYYSAIDFIVIQ